MMPQSQLSTSLIHKMISSEPCMCPLSRPLCRLAPLPAQSPRYNTELLHTTTTHVYPQLMTRISLPEFRQHYALPAHTVTPPVVVWSVTMGSTAT